MEFKAAVQVFPVMVDQCLSGKKISILDNAKLNKDEASTKYKELFDLFQDETIFDTKEIIAAMGGAITEAETYADFDRQIDDLDIKIFNDDVEETTTKEKE